MTEPNQGSATEAGPDAPGRRAAGADRNTEFDLGPDPFPVTGSLPAAAGAAAGSTAGTRAAARSRRRNLLPVVTISVAIVVLALDQISKYFAVRNLSDGHRVDLIGSAFGLRLTRNAGAAFSTATGATWLLTVVAIAVVIVIIRISRRLGSRGWACALGFLLGGALGNLTDRLARAPGVFQGHVIDFLEFPHWPIFNLADSSITTAAVLIALLSLAGIGIDGTRMSSGSSETEAEHDD
jgi:signal peptidase II